MTIAKRIKSARVASGLSQTDLAKKVRMDQTAISEIELGKVNNPRKLKEIAEVLEVSESWLRFGDSEATNQNLTKQEFEIISMLRKLKLTDKNSVKRVIKGLLIQNNGKN